MKLCYQSLLFSFFHLKSYWPIVTIAIYANFRDYTAVPYWEVRGWIQSQTTQWQSSYDGCNQYEDQQTPHIAIPQPRVFLKIQHIVIFVLERCIWNIEQHIDTVQTGNMEHDQHKMCLKWKNFNNQKCKENYSYAWNKYSCVKRNRIPLNFCINTSTFK
jgi:hypothetical protein